jgi:hypothetical protein
LCERESEREANRANKSEGKSINTAMIRIVQHACGSHPNLIKSVAYSKQRGYVEKNPALQRMFMQRLIFESWAYLAKDANNANHQKTYKAFHAELRDCLSKFLNTTIKTATKTKKNKAKNSDEEQEDFNKYRIVKKVEKKGDKDGGEEEEKEKDADDAKMASLRYYVNNLSARDEDPLFHTDNDYDYALTAKKMPVLSDLDIQNVINPKSLEFFVATWIQSKFCHQSDNGTTFSDKWRPMPHILFATVASFGISDQKSAGVFISMMENNGKKSIDQYVRNYSHEVGDMIPRQIVSFINC